MIRILFQEISQFTGSGFMLELVMKTTGTLKNGVRSVRAVRVLFEIGGKDFAGGGPLLLKR